VTFPVIRPRAIPQREEPPLNPNLYLGCVHAGAELNSTMPIDLTAVPAPCRAEQMVSFPFITTRSSRGDRPSRQIRSARFFQSAPWADFPEEMGVFRCDSSACRKAPRSRFTPGILDRARSIEPFDLVPHAHEGRTPTVAWDMGDSVLACFGAPAGRTRLMRRKYKMV